MNKIINYILYFVMLCASTSCIYEDAPEELNESEKGYTYFDLRFSTRRQYKTEDGGLNNLTLWLTEQNNPQAITFSKTYTIGTDIQFVKGNNEGEYFCKISDHFLKTKIGKGGTYDVYAVINNNFTPYDKGTQLSAINQDFDPSLLSKVSFKKNIINNINKSEKGIPMYGKSSITITEKNDSPTSAASCMIDVIRALSKLELYFAHTNKVKSLAITNVTLKNMPDEGYLVYDASRTIKGNKASSIILYSGTGSITNQATDFKDYTKFQNLGLTNPYLLENTTGDPSPTATVYIPSTDKPAIDGAYQIEVTYNLNSTTEKTSIISFPRINRNELFKVYILADQQEIYVDVQTSLQWDKGPDLNPEYQ